MGSTNKTSIGLSQFIDTDKPTWLGDYNTDMETITTNVESLKVATSSVAMGAITKLETTVSALGDSVTANTNDIASIQNDVATNKASIDTLTADLATLDTREQAHYDALKGQYDTQDTALEDLQKQQNHFELNMNKIEADVVVNTASIGKMQVKIATLESASSTAESEIDTLKTDVDNLQAETDTLDTTTREQDTAIKNLQTSVATNTTNIGLLDNRVTVVEGYGTDITTLQSDVSNLQTDMSGAMSDITANDAAIKAQQAITANIESGVDVPFGFGTTADGKRGYDKGDGTIEPFVTSEEYNDLQEDVTGNMADIASLEKKVTNVTDGVSIPYSLGIADGGAYGYIKNGEQGVTPFVGQDEVDALVKVSPVITDLQSDVTTLETATANIKYSPTIVAQSDGGVSVGTTPLRLINGHGANVNVTLAEYLGASDALKIPFSFGVDSNGNYGYIKAGADSVTPFLSPIDTTSTITTAYSATQVGQYLPATQSLTYYAVPTIDMDELYLIKSSGAAIKLTANIIDNSTNPIIRSIAKFFNVKHYFSDIPTKSVVLCFATTGTSPYYKTVAALVDQNNEVYFI